MNKKLTIAVLMAYVIICILIVIRTIQSDRRIERKIFNKEFSGPIKRVDYGLVLK